MRIRIVSIAVAAALSAVMANAALADDTGGAKRPLFQLTDDTGGAKRPLLVDDTGGAKRPLFQLTDDTGGAKRPLVVAG